MSVWLMGGLLLMGTSCLVNWHVMSAMITDLFNTRASMQWLSLVLSAMQFLEYLFVLGRMFAPLCSEGRRGILCADWYYSCTGDHRYCT